MAFCFRIRFELGPQSVIHSPETHLTLTKVDDGEDVELGSIPKDASLKDSRSLALMGSSYKSEAEASQAAERWLGLIQKAFARVNLGADFGDRAPKGAWTKYGLKYLEERIGHRVLNDVHGISVFECEPEPKFSSLKATPTVGIQPERLMNAIAVTTELGASMSGREQLAYDLYSASFFEFTADARLAMLMMAMETMIDPQPRPDAVRGHVDQLILTRRLRACPGEKSNRSWAT